MRSGGQFTDSIICARGESSRTFVPVIRALSEVGCVVLVNDGDNQGLDEAMLAGAEVVDTPYRSGKSFAMLYGLEFISTDRVIFCDADITGFTAEHARYLARDHDGMIVGLVDNGSEHLGPIPPVSGQRSLPADVARYALSGCEDGYSAETAINAEIGNRGLPVSTFVMRGVRNPSKQPFTRVLEVSRAVIMYVSGLAGYVISWLKTLFASLKED